METMTKNLTQQQIADLHGCSKITVTRAKAAGVDIQIPHELKAYFASNRSGPHEKDSKDMEAAKLRKINLECKRIQIGMDKQLGILVSREEVEAVFLRAGVIVGMSLDRLCDLLPPALEGLESSQMKTKLMDFMRQARMDLAEELQIDEE